MSQNNDWTHAFIRKTYYVLCIIIVYKCVNLQSAYCGFFSTFLVWSDNIKMCHNVPKAKVLQHEYTVFQSQKFEL